MTVLPDLAPAARQMARLLDGLTDDQLAAPTPCEQYTLGDLIDHVGGLSLAFTAAAAKKLGPDTSQGPSGDATRLDADWRTRIPGRLAALAEAWRDPEAWEGMTQVGGVDLPGDMAGKAALNELVIHGWDVARASGQTFGCDPKALDSCLQFVSLVSAPEQADSIFGPAVDVPADAPMLDRVLGLTGRDPAWTPAR
jgi:uncharacterized protein (TIGR03086 family)